MACFVERKTCKIHPIDLDNANTHSWHVKSEKILLENKNSRDQHAKFLSWHVWLNVNFKNQHRTDLDHATKNSWHVKSQKPFSENKTSREKHAKFLSWHVWLKVILFKLQSCTIE